MKRRPVLTALAAALITSASLVAHHSWPGAYDLHQQVILKGKVVKVAFQDPHVRYTIETKNSGDWEAEWTNTADSTRRGITEDTIHVGDFLEIVGSPSRESGRHLIAMYWEIRRLADGTRWRGLDEWKGPPVIE